MSKAPEPIILAVALALLAARRRLDSLTFIPTVADHHRCDQPRTGRDIPARSPSRAMISSIQPCGVEYPRSCGMRTADNHHRLFAPGRVSSSTPPFIRRAIIIKKIGPEYSVSPSGVLLSLVRKSTASTLPIPTSTAKIPMATVFPPSSSIPQRSHRRATVKRPIVIGTQVDQPDRCSIAIPIIWRVIRLQTSTSCAPFHIQFKGYEQLNGVYFFQLLSQRRA